MTEVTLPPPAPSSTPDTDGRHVNLFIANTHDRVLSEARGRAQKDFLAAQEKDKLNIHESGRLGRMIRSGVRSMGREIYMARKTKAHMQELQENGQEIGNEAATETRLSAMQEGVRLEGVIKDRLVRLAQELRDEGVGPAQTQGRMEQFLRTNKNDKALCEAFGVKKLNKRIIAYASVDMAGFVRSVDANADGIDAINLHVANMKADKSRAYGSKHSEKLAAVASTSLTVAAIKTAGVRIPASVIRHVPGVGSALAGAGLGAVRGYTREGMNQVHRKGNVIAGAERTDDVIDKLEQSLHADPGAESMRHIVRQLLPLIEIQQQYGVSFFDSSGGYDTVQHKDADGNPIIQTPEQYMVHLFARVVHKADIASLSAEQKAQLREDVAKRQDELMPYVQGKLKEMKQARRRKAVAGAVVGAAAGATMGVGGKWIAGRAESAYHALGHVRAGRAGDHIAMSGSAAHEAQPTAPTTSSLQEVPTSRAGASTTTTVPEHPTTTHPAAASEAVTTPATRPASTIPEYPTTTTVTQESHAPITSTEHPQAPSIVEAPAAPVVPEAVAGSREAVIESFGHYEVQSGDNITWIIKDHMLQSHPELTYGQLDQPPYAGLIQESINRLASERGVGIDSLHMIHPGDHPFEGVDAHRVFDPLFAQFDQDHPVMSAQEAVSTIVQTKPEHVVVDLPVGNASGSQLHEVAQQEFEARLQRAFAVPPEQAHAITQDLMTPRRDGYIPEGSLLDFINRGPIDGHLITHFDPKEVVGTSEWRNQTLTIPSTVSFRPTEPNPEAREWLTETLNTYLSLRGRSKDRYTNEELASLYVYIRGKKQESITIADLDSWFLHDQGLQEKLMDTSVSVPAAPLPIAEQVTEQAAETAVAVTESTKEIGSEAGDGVLRTVGQWFEDHAVEATGIGAGTVAVVGTGLTVRHMRRRRLRAPDVRHPVEPVSAAPTATEPAPEPVAEEPIPEPSAAPRRVVAHAPFVPRERATLFPTVPDAHVGMPGRLYDETPAERRTRLEELDVDLGTPITDEIGTSAGAPDLSGIDSEPERFDAVEGWFGGVDDYDGMSWHDWSGRVLVASVGEDGRIRVHKGDGSGPVIANMPRSGFRDWMIDSMVEGAVSDVTTS